MINMFKKGSYKLSAIALIFFIALGCCTLTNAETGTNTTLKPEKNTETEQFSFDEAEKVFSTLDRAIDFIDFDLKVPDKMPTEKPVALCAYPIQNSSAPNSIVLDPFSGSFQQASLVSS